MTRLALWLLAALPALPAVATAQDVTPTKGRSDIRLLRSEQVFEPMLTNRVSLGDLDGDGDLDAVFGNFGTAGTQVWLNDGRGRFVDSGQRLSRWCHGVALGDLDDDGDLDLLLAGGRGRVEGETFSSPSRLYLNDGRAGFLASEQDFDDAELSCTGVELIHLDADGLLDAALVYYDRENKPPNRLYLNRGPGRLERFEDDFPSGATWGDLDGDGDHDMVFRLGGVGFRAALNDGRGRFVESWRLDDAAVTRGFMALGDVDRDGDLDAMVTDADRERQRPTRLLVNVGGGRFEDSGQRLAPSLFGRLTLVDLDLDGAPEALVTAFEQATQLWLNDGRGAFVDSGVRLEHTGIITQISVGDLDGDRRPDLFLANFRGGPNAVYLNR